MSKSPSTHYSCQTQIATLADKLAQSLDPADDALIKTLWADEAKRR